MAEYPDRPAGDVGGEDGPHLGDHDNPQWFTGTRYRPDYRQAYGEAYDDEAGRFRRYRTRRKVRSEIRSTSKDQRREYIRGTSGRSMPLAVPVMLAVAVGAVAIWAATHHHDRGHHAVATRSSSTSATATSSPSATAPSSTTAPAPLRSGTSVQDNDGPTATRTATGGRSSAPSVAELAALDACSYSWHEGLTSWRARVQRWLTGPAVAAWKPTTSDTAQWQTWITPHQVSVTCSPTTVTTSAGATATTQQLQVTLRASTSSTDALSVNTVHYAVTAVRAGSEWSVTALDPR